MTVDECLAGVRWVRFEHEVYMLRTDRPGDHPLFRAIVQRDFEGWIWSAEIVTPALGEVERAAVEPQAEYFQAEHDALEALRAMLDDLHPRMLEVPA